MSVEPIKCYEPRIGDDIAWLVEHMAKLEREQQDELVRLIFPNGRSAAFDH